jgi:hypothetical protein
MENQKKIVTSEEEITKEWCIYALNLNFSFSTIDSIEIEKCKVNGEMSEVRVINLKYISPIDDSKLHPNSVFIKYPKYLDKSSFMNIARELGGYKNEVRFYKSVLSNKNFAKFLPEIYYAEIDENSDLFVIIMENLEESGALIK